MSAVPKLIRTEVVVSHRGKRYTLWRRGDNFYLRFSRHGKPILRTLGTSLKELAVKQAKAELDKLESNGWKPKKPEEPKGLATIGDILDRWEKSTELVTISHLARRNYASSLRCVLRDATGKENVDGLCSSILNEDTVDAYITHCREIDPETEKQRRPDHSISATLTQARCVLQPGYLKIYKGLKLPDLQGWRARKRFVAKRDYGFIQFPRSMVIEMEAAAERLYQDRNPVWVVYILMGYLGMRNSQAEQAKWSHIREESVIKEGKAIGTRHVIDIEAGYEDAVARTLGIPAEWYEKLKAFQKEGDDFLIPARHATERNHLCNKEICDFMAKYIPDREKKAYELRKWAGSKVLTLTGSIVKAQYFLGHKSLNTTQRYYAKYLKTISGLTSSDTREIYALDLAETTTANFTP